MFAFLRTTKGLVVVGAAAFLVIAIIAATSNGDRQIVRVVRGDIAQTVTVTGNIQPAESVDLGFEASGRVSLVSAQVGDVVITGDLLAALESNELFAELRDAQAKVLSQQAQLNELLQGTRQEDLAIKESEVRKAEQDLQNEIAGSYDVLLDAYTKANNALRVQLSDVLDNKGTSTNPNFSLTFSCICDIGSNTAGDRRNQVELELVAWEATLAELSFSSPASVLDGALRSARDDLILSLALVDRLNVILSDSRVGLEAADIADYQSNVSTARTNIVSALAAVNGQLEDVAAESLALDRVLNELALLRAGATPEAIASQRALVLSAQAQADRISALIAQRSIKSPIDGIVTVQEAKVGQSVAANEILVSVISQDALEIEADIPEVDIGRLASDSFVRIYPDALPGEEFTGHVLMIDPAETVTDGVVNYTVKIGIDAPDPRFRSGMTVSLDIESERTEDALILPRYAIQRDANGRPFVEVLRGREVFQLSVTTGTQSQDGMVQILSGLSEGEEVLVPTE